MQVSAQMIHQQLARATMFMYCLTTMILPKHAVMRLRQQLQPQQPRRLRRLRQILRPPQVRYQHVYCRWSGVNTMVNMPPLLTAMM